MSRLSHSNSSADDFEQYDLPRSNSASSSHSRSGSSASERRSTRSRELSNKRSRSSLSDSAEEDNDETIVMNNNRDAHSYIDHLIKDLGLTSKQAANLHRLTTQGNSFRSGELIFRLTELANTFKSQNLLNEVLVKCANTEKFLADLRLPTGSKWSLNDDQNKALLALVKQVMFDAKFPKYGQLSQYTKVMAEKKAVTLGFPEAFDGNANRLSIFVRELGAKCRNVRGQFKGHIKEFTFGPKRLVFAKFCEEMATKYSQKGIINIPKEQKDRLALLRRYARMHPDILGAEDENDGEEELSADESAPVSDAEENVSVRIYRRSQNKPSKNKKKVAVRVPKGHWWSQVDHWLAKLKKNFGEDMESEDWKAFLSETHTMEDQAFTSSEQFANFDQVFGEFEDNLNRPFNAVPPNSGRASVSFGASSEGQGIDDIPLRNDFFEGHTSGQNSPNYAGTPPPSQPRSHSGSERMMALPPLSTLPSLNAAPPPSSQPRSRSGSERGPALPPPPTLPRLNPASHGLPPSNSVFSRGNAFPPSLSDPFIRPQLSGARISAPANYTGHNGFTSPGSSYTSAETREYHPPANAQSEGIAVPSLHLPAISSDNHGGSQHTGIQNWTYGSNGEGGQRLTGSPSSFLHDGSANFSGQHAEMAGRFD